MSHRAVGQMSLADELVGRRAGQNEQLGKIERLVHDRSLRLATGLAVAVAIPVAILFYFQFRSISALSQTSALVLRQLSQATSEGVTDVLVDALRTVRVDVLLKIGQRQTEPLDLPFIENTFEQGLIADPFVDLPVWEKQLHRRHDRWTHLASPGR